MINIALPTFAIAIFICNQFAFIGNNKVYFRIPRYVGRGEKALFLRTVNTVDSCPLQFSFFWRPAAICQKSDIQKMNQNVSHKSLFAFKYLQHDLNIITQKEFQ
jgi:hypothetical protein